MKKHSITCLIIAATLEISGCASINESDYSASAGSLGALANRQITVHQSDLKNASVEGALNSYRRAANLFKSPVKRNKSIQRMAKLALRHATQTELKPDTSKTSPSSKQPVTADGFDKQVDKQLYKMYMYNAKQSDSKKETRDMLGMAGRMAGRLDSIKLEGNYKTAIRLYKLLLQQATSNKERASTLYRLAHAYAMAGDLKNELNTLTQLTSQYPSSPHYVESQFRRGEMLFSFSEYDTAAGAYTAVVNAGPASGHFYTQSLYKLGWSQYKLANFNQSLQVFFRLLGELDKTKLANEKSLEFKLFDDTTRVIGLAFSRLDGPDSVSQWFASHPEDRIFDKRIYKSLGGVYLHQERYRDAAKAYGRYVKTHPNNIAAPTFSTLKIKAYKAGDYPSLVLPAKKEFVIRYGIHSQFWKDHPTQRKEYAGLLKSHLLDVATYYHALAQKADTPVAYEKPIRWYKEYLQTPPVSKQQADINLRYASVLFSAQHYQEAIKQFTYTAYQYPGYAQAHKAGYAALLSYQSRFDKLLKQRKSESKEAAKKTQTVIDALRKNKIQAGLKFAKSFPSDEHVPTVYKSIVEDQLAANLIDDAVSTAGFLVNRQPQPEVSYLRFGWKTIANGEYDLARYQVAEAAYRHLLTLPGITVKNRKTYRNMQAKSVYQQAANYKRANKPKKAAAEFLRVAQVYPQASIRKKADFTAAAIYLQLKQYTTAIPILVAFKQRFPKDELAKTIPAKLAVAYEQTGNYTKAASQLEYISDHYGVKNKELARQALWKAAKMQDRANNPTASIHLYRKYARQFPTPYNFQAEAHYRLLKLYREQKDSRHVTEQLKALVATHDAAGNKADARVTWLAAYAAFQLAEPLYDRFNAIQLTLPLKKSLARKSAAMKTALVAYKQVRQLKVADFTPAANYRIASIYQALANDIVHSQRPSGMGKLEGMQYNMLLHDQAMPYSDKAIGMYKVTANLAHAGIYNKWVSKSFAALAKLVPGRYAKFEQVEGHVDIIY